MECVAWTLHRYVMHGWGWGWHRSHHEPGGGVTFEKNDLYAVCFSVLVVGLFLLGTRVEWVWWVALGITAYGAIYAFVHDMLVHQRGGFRWVPRRGYFRRLLQAHRLHHAVEGRDGTVSHGFLFAPDPARLKAELARRRGAEARLRAPDRPRA
jgi:beta-carotene 3-hydroxylase